MIEIYHEGRVQSLASCFAKQKNSVPTLRAASHKSLKPGSEWNTLLVVVRERRVQAFINGVAALEPFEATHKITPSVLSMLGMGRNKARAEFKRFTLWRLEPDGGGKE